MSGNVVPLRSWERIVLALLGLLIVAYGAGVGGVVGAVVVAFGLLWTFGALGVIELVMALWYRFRRSRT